MFNVINTLKNYLGKKLADFPDLFECGQNPFIIFQFFYKSVDPLHLLSISVLEPIGQLINSNKYTLFLLCILVLDVQEMFISTPSEAKSQVKIVFECVKRIYNFDAALAILVNSRS